MGMQNDTATLQGSLAVFYKTKKSFTEQSRNCAPWFLPKVEDSCIPKNLHTNVYSSLTENSPKLAPTWISFNRCVVKLWSTHTVEHHSATHRNELLKHTIAWMDLQGIMVSEIASSKI